MSTTALTNILARLKGVKRNGKGFVARCPAHDDSNPSLAVSDGADGKVLLHCHAGCTLDAILAALGLATSDLFAADTAITRAPAPKRRIVATYDYRTDAGDLLY